MPNANSFPDGQRGRARSGDLGRVADYSVSTLPVRGPGVVGRRFPSGSLVRALPVRRGGGTRAKIPPLTVVAANDDEHPGRVRVLKGRLCGLLPSQMHLLDVVLPSGTDNRCYLTMPEGTGYVYGKVLVAAAGALFGPADVYQVTSSEEADNSYLYLLIATVITTGGKPVVVMEWEGGNWNPAAAASSDGSIFTPVGA